jgi:hypothetical protein
VDDSRYASLGHNLNGFRHFDCIDRRESACIGERSGTLKLIAIPSLGFVARA